jgi:hypothetical protein
MNEDDNNEEMVMTGAIKPRTREWRSTIREPRQHISPDEMPCMRHSAVQQFSRLCGEQNSPQRRVCGLLRRTQDELLGDHYDYDSGCCPPHRRTEIENQ